MNRNDAGSAPASSKRKTSRRIERASRRWSPAASHDGCMSSRKKVGLPSRVSCLASQVSQAMVSLGAKRISLPR